MKKELRGFSYTVTKEQVEQHQKRSVEEILIWLQSTYQFIRAVQTPEERERMDKIRRGEKF